MRMPINDLISVIIPVYNVEKYLKDCVESVINQSYSNLEIILVDDGSTDDSGKLCDYYSKNDHRIKVIHKKNEGLGFARNSGLEISRGKFVTFVDSDDYVAENMISNLYENLMKNKVDECKLGYKKVNNSKKVIFRRTYKFELFLGNDVKNEYLPRLIGSLPKKHDSIEMCVTGTLFRNEIIKKNFVKFPSERELISEDLIFQLKYLQYAKGALTITQEDYFYRFNEKSLSNSYRKDRFEKSIIFYKEVNRLLNEYNCSTETYFRVKMMLFINLKMCISQEVLNNKLSIKEKITNIHTICCNNTVQESINSFPIQELNFSKRVFLWLVKSNKAYLLYLLKKLALF